MSLSAVGGPRECAARLGSELGREGGGREGKGGEDAEEEEEEEEDPDTPSTHYECLFGRAPRLPESETGVFYETHGAGVNSQFGSDERYSHFGLFKRVDAAGGEDRKRRRPRFAGTAEEKAAWLADLAPVHPLPGVGAAELVRRAEWSRLAAQPEGVARSWHRGGRVVLAGDAAVQMTSQAGMGFNCSLQNAVALVNMLHEAVRGGEGNKQGEGNQGGGSKKGWSPPSPSPSPGPEALARVFAEYQRQREPPSRAILDLSQSMIRGNTWAGWTDYLTTEYLVPYVLGFRRVINMASDQMVSRAAVLPMRPFEPRTGTIPWAWKAAA